MSFQNPGSGEGGGGREQRLGSELGSEGGSVDETLELQGLLCSVTRKEAGRELRLGTDTRSLRMILARDLRAKGSEFRNPQWRGERRPKARVKWPKRTIKSIRDAGGAGQHCRC